MNEDKAKNRRADTSRPGALRSAAAITIQTALAQRLMTGRKPAEGVSEIIGVINFGLRTQQLWLASSHDDPYADWFLLRIEQSLEAARVMIGEETTRIEGILESISGLTIDMAHSIEPVSIELKFANPYGYMAAYLVGEYDRLLLVVMTARHLALIDRDQCDQIINATGKKIRRALNYGVLWRYTGVTRVDVIQKNQNAARAAELMGDLPEKILNLEGRAKMAPAIRPLNEQIPSLKNKEQGTTTPRKAG